MAKNGKDTKHTRHIPIGMHFVINGKELNLNKTVWCKQGLQLADSGTKMLEDMNLIPYEDMLC